MKCVIASDFHIKFCESDEDKKRRQIIENFLNSLIGNTDCLILAGDIFDLWVEWDKVIIKQYFSILNILLNLHNSGCKLIFLSGNHDFWLESFLSDQIGFEVHQDDFNFVFNGKKIFVSHGDLYTKNDLRYQVFRKFVRSGFIKKIFKIIHPDLSLSFGQLLSRSSRDRKDPVELIIKKENGLIEKAKFLSADFDYIIMGHSHRPTRIEMDNSVYVNCGDWIKNFTYCKIENSIISLEKFIVKGM